MTTKDRAEHLERLRGNSSFHAWCGLFLIEPDTFIAQAHQDFEAARGPLREFGQFIQGQMALREALGEPPPTIH